MRHRLDAFGNIVPVTESFMSECRTRRTIALATEAVDGLEKIKSITGVVSDNAAINDAIRFRAGLVNRSPDEVQIALSLYDKLRKDSGSGFEVFTERSGEPATRTNLFVPTLGR